MRTSRPRTDSLGPGSVSRIPTSASATRTAPRSKTVSPAPSGRALIERTRGVPDAPEPGFARAWRISVTARAGHTRDSCRCEARARAHSLNPWAPTTRWSCQGDCAAGQGLSTERINPSPAARNSPARAARPAILGRGASTEWTTLSNHTANDEAEEIGRRPRTRMAVPSRPWARRMTPAGEWRVHGRTALKYLDWGLTVFWDQVNIN
jgi:hypothetical protein